MAATMSSPPPEGVGITVKTVVPMMAEKILASEGVNGTANISPADSTSPASQPDLNGHANAEAHAVNGSLTTAEPARSTNGPDEASPDGLSNGQMADAPEPQIAQLDGSLQADAPRKIEPADAMEDVQAVIDQAVDTAMKDVVPASAVPPIVEAPSSDVRDEAPNKDTSSMESQPEPQAQSSPVTEQEPQPTEPQSQSPAPGSQMQLDDVPEATAPTTQALSPLDTSSIVEPPTQPTTQPSLAEDSILPKSESMQESPLDMVGTQASDTPLSDVKDLSLKTERREDDVVDGEPSAKRQRTLDGASSPQSPAPQNGDISVAELTARTLSPADVKELVKQVKNTARSKAGANFAKPVVEAIPHLAEPYNAKITNPMDLRTMEQKLIASHYATFDDVLADVELMANNSILFNGPDHFVSKLGLQVKESFLRKIVNYLNPPLPPPAPPKRRASTPASDKKMPRKASRAPPAPVVPPTPTYALNPETNTPVIRRDSSVLDASRPKREIHPPKNKDLEYQNVRPRSKKYALELKFCDSVLAELKKPRYDPLTMWFSAPVDPVALGIPDYLKKIKKPMDLGTVSQKLEAGFYERAKDFEADMRLIFKNCYQFNGKDHAVSKAAHELEAYFDAEWAKKDTFIANHTPIARSPAAVPDEDESEEDEQSDDEVNDDAGPSAADSAHADRLIAEQSKLISMMTSGSASRIEIEMQQGVVNAIQAIAEKIKADTGKSSKGKGKNKNKAAAGSKKQKKPGAPSRKSSGTVGVPPARKPKPKRDVFIGTVEKEIISTGLAHLPEVPAEEALSIIQGDRRDVEIAEDGTLELDIDLISEVALRKIYALILKHAPHIKKQVEKDFNDKKASASQGNAQKPAGAKKKHKPMNAREQEAQIAKLGAAIGVNGSPQSPGSAQGFPTAPEAESSGDEASDSEEE